MTEPSVQELFIPVQVNFLVRDEFIGHRHATPQGIRPLSSEKSYVKTYLPLTLAIDPTQQHTAVDSIKWVHFLWNCIVCVTHCNETIHIMSDWQTAEMIPIQNIGNLAGTLVTRWMKDIATLFRYDKNMIN